MAKRVVWTYQAKIDRYQILTYWKKHNKSNIYSNKLNRQFNDAVKSIREYPLMNKSVSVENVRVKIVTHFLIIYKVLKKEIVILRLWDSRRNPEELKL